MFAVLYRLGCRKAGTCPAELQLNSQETLWWKGRWGKQWPCRSCPWGRVVSSTCTASERITLSLQSVGTKLCIALHQHLCGALVFQVLLPTEQTGTGRACRNLSNGMPGYVWTFFHLVHPWAVTMSCALLRAEASLVLCPSRARGWEHKNMQKLGMKLLPSLC